MPLNYFTDVKTGGDHASHCFWKYPYNSVRIVCLGRHILTYSCSQSRGSGPPFEHEVPCEDVVALNVFEQFLQFEGPRTQHFHLHQL